MSPTWELASLPVRAMITSLPNPRHHKEISVQHVLELQAMEAADQDHLPEVVNGSTISILLCQDDF